jgi:long-chain acyl-CoA synthetase
MARDAVAGRDDDRGKAVSTLVIVQTVLAQFDATARRCPKRVAIYWGDERIRYGEVAARITRFAANLQARLAFGKGDRIGLFVKNRPEFIYALFAILKSGAVAVPINTFLKTPEVQHIANDCQLAGLITGEELRDVADKLQHVRLLDIADLAQPAAAAAPKFTEPPLDDLAVIIYTSGTTGKSKGAMLTHANFAANVSSCIRVLDKTERDRVTLLLPMFHSFMLTVCILTPLSIGGSIVLIKSVQPFHHAIKEIIRARATILIGIPQLFQAMVHAHVPFYVHWLLNLRVAISGAAPLPRETLVKFNKKFRFPLLEGYGLSEAAPVVSFNPLHGIRKTGSTGLPVPNVEVRIFDDDDNELPTDTVGEIVVRGTNVMRGYWNQHDENALTLRNGWLHTGDMGKKDSDGYIFIVDRKKEMLLVHGMNVYPREIEEVLYTFPGIHEAAVIGRDVPTKGELPIAFVSATPGGPTLNPKEILAHCRERLAEYKVPREIRILDKLPRVATGKIAKLELKKLA